MAQYAVGLGGALNDEPYVYAVNPHAGNYDSPGHPVWWANKSSYMRDTETHKAWVQHQIKFARFIADALNRGEFDPIFHSPTAP